MMGLNIDGEELTRIPMHVRSYSYIWNGTVDQAGRIWKPEAHSNDGRPSSSEEGLTERTFRRYLKFYDPRSDITDSIYLGEASRRTHIARNSRGGRTFRGVPFDPSPLAVVDPNGGVWDTDNAASGETEAPHNVPSFCCAASPVTSAAYPPFLRCQ